MGAFMRERVTVPGERISECKSYREALALCFSLAGLPLAEVAWDCGWRDGGKVLSRILRLTNEGDDVRHMPGDKLVPFMVACGNMVPLRWWLLQIGRPFPEVADDLPLAEEVIHLRRKVAQLEQSVLTRADLQEVLRELQTPVVRRRVHKSKSRFSLRGTFIVPAWMRVEAAEMARDMESGS